MSDYFIGIDLGTTHSAVYYSQSGQSQAGRIQQLAIPQFIAAGQVRFSSFITFFCLLSS